ncbi:MAG: DUF998 domain-containing protein [Candidatus Thermoplasmatota archaeon]|jgi:hypothetical membrane protein|nr:DUF998 domain-containing protein [Candidatus Thermoplasmatota archaeon]
MSSKKFLIGLFGPVITILLILLDIRMSAYFSWYTNSLSSLGIHRYYYIFDAAVIIGGISVFIFALMLYRQIQIKFLSIGFIMLGSVSLFLIGIFNENFGNLHLAIAIIYFIFTPVGIIIFSFYRIRNYLSYYGFFAGVASLGTIIFGILVLFEYIHLKIGLSVTEMAEAVLLGSWSSILGVYLSTHEAQ